MSQYTRATNFAILVIAMVAWIMVLSGVLYLVLAAVPHEPEQRDYLLRLAYLTTGVLGVSVILLVAIVAHYAASRLRHPTEQSARGEYEDAWTEAGRRLKPEDAPPIDGFEEDNNKH
ncbi:MAG: hypothetical protein KAV00_11710 [Phycisphaerae bacterium]|nr:hypothetical protein [Phycisphaerae bacterium]